MNAVVGLLATSPVRTVNVESLCRDWSVGKEKAYALLNALEYIGVLNIVGAAGRPRVGKGAKLLLADPSLYACLGGGTSGRLAKLTWWPCSREQVTLFLPVKRSPREILKWRA